MILERVGKKKYSAAIMRSNFVMWFISYLTGVCLVQVCLAALPINGAHELDNSDAQEQQAVAQHGGKSSLLHGNRVFNRAVRGPQVNAAVPRLNPQLKSQANQPKSTSTTAPEVELEKEVDENTAVLKEDSENSEEQPKEETSPTTTTSTEPTRKPFGVVRPFRSNKDLLDSLKRRRQMQQLHGYTVVPPTAPSSTSEKPQNKLSTQSTARKGGNLHNKSPSFSVDQTGIGSQKKSTSTRRYNSKPIISSTTPNIQHNDAIIDESNAVSQASRSRTYPKTRRIS